MTAPLNALPAQVPLDALHRELGARMAPLFLRSQDEKGQRQR